MGRMVTLPSGGWVEVRPENEVPERLRRPITRALRAVRAENMQLINSVNARLRDAQDRKDEEAVALAQTDLARTAHEMAPEEIDGLSDANDHGIVAFLEKWSRPGPITLDAVVDLPHADYDALRKLVAPLVNALFVDASPSPEPTSPFDSSNGSDTGSPAETSLTRPSTGEPTP